MFNSYYMYISLWPVDSGNEMTEYYIFPSFLFVLWKYFISSMVLQYIRCLKSNRKEGKPIAPHWEKEELVICFRGALPYPELESGLETVEA